VASPPASVEEIAMAIARAYVEGASVYELATEIYDALLSDRAAMAERVAGLEQKLKAAEATIDTLLRAQDHYREAMDERNTFKNQTRASEAEVARLREALEKTKADRLRLDRRIHNQRCSLRRNWEIVESRARSRLPGGYGPGWEGVRSKWFEVWERKDKELRTARAALTRPDDPTKET